MEKLITLLKVAAALGLALYFRRRSFELFDEVASFLLLFATFGLLLEAVSLPVLKLLRMPIKPYLAVFYAFLILFTLGAVLFYNKTRPPIAKLVLRGGAEVCSDGRCFKVAPERAEVFEFRKPARVSVNGKDFFLERGVYLFSTERVRVVLYRLKEFKRLSKTKTRAEVERRELGTFGGFARVYENPRAVIYTDGVPPREEVIKRGEVLAVED